MEKEQITEWLKHVIAPIVKNKEAIEVNQSVDDMGVLFTVKVDPADAGALIGKQGRTAQAVRTLLSVVGMVSDIRASMKLDVPDKPNYAGERA